MPDAPRYHAVCVSNRAPRSAGTGWVWSRPFDSPAEAWDEVTRQADAGLITLGFVVEVGPGGRRLAGSRIWPANAKRIIQHYWELLEQLRNLRP